MDWSQFSNFTQENISYFYINKIKINKKSPLLEKIKSERKLIVDFIKSNNIDIKIKEIITDKLENKIIKYSNVFFVDQQNLLNDIVNLDRTFELSWLSKHNMSNHKNRIYIRTTIDNIINIIKRVKILILIAEYLKFKSNSLNKVINMYLILSNLKKNIPNLNEKIDVKHVNSGYTDHSINIIFIWRYEEFEKVFFHELIHFFDMDYSHNHISCELEIDGPTNYSEAITDFWGIFYHIIYISLITNNSIKKLLEIELSFIQNQAMQINNYYDLNDWKKTPNKIIKQKTPAMSYYILKYLLFNFFLTNEFNELSNFSRLLNKILDIGFKTKEFNKIKSSRMTLLQLK
jgi:hypothetical protein